MSGGAEGKKVAIVGGGVAGLAAAHRLQALAASSGESLQIVLFERDRVFGGKVQSRWSKAGLLIERGPDSFLTRKPALLDLIGEIGLTDQLIATQGSALSSFIYRKGRMRRLPPGMGALVPADLFRFLRSDLLSPGGRLRVLRDLWLSPPPDGDLSLRELIGPRLGDEFLTQVAEPLIAGIHSAEPEQMSVAATVPGLLTLLTRDRSLIRGARRQMRARSGPTSPPFMSLRDGMGSLVSALEGQLGAVERRLGSEVQAIAKAEGRLRLRAKGADMGGKEELVDAVVLATPAHLATGLALPLWPDLAQELAEIPAHPVLTITYAYLRPEIEQVLPGHGWLVPRGEGTRMRGATVMTNKWQGRSRSSELVSIRAFLGGAGQAALNEVADERLIEQVADEVGRLLAVSARPIEATVERVLEGNPEYRVGHIERVARIDQLLDDIPNLAVAGASYRGIGLPDVVRSGQEAAARVWKGLHGREGEADTVIR